MPRRLTYLIAFAELIGAVAALALEATGIAIFLAAGAGILVATERLGQPERTSVAQQLKRNLWLARTGAVTFTWVAALSALDVIKRSAVAIVLGMITVLICVKWARVTRDDLEATRT
jgi:DMSO reductase anchor subunit